MPSSPSTTGNPSPPPETTPPPQQPPPMVRKFPAPCWTQDETLALINVYQDKWYSLRRRNLRTADWEAVADEVNRRCPNQDPPKTSAQCRHKMEKLRKRYRAEKQRIASLPYVTSNRLFPPSSWVFFDLMDSMEAGPGSGPGSGPGVGPGLGKEKERLNLVVQSNSGSSCPFVKEEKMMINGKNDLGKYFDEILMGSMGKNNSNNNPNSNMNFGNSNNTMKFKVKNQNFNKNERYFDEGYDYNGNENDGFDDYRRGRSFNGGGFGGGGGVGGGGGGNKRKLGGEEVLNGGGSAAMRVERGKDVVAEMAASIKMLGEGLIRMETMKMEMMQEMERKRMEMEMKRNEMMLESQHVIVNAFLQGLKKHKKVKVMQQFE